MLWKMRCAAQKKQATTNEPVIGIAVESLSDVHFRKL